MKYERFDADHFVDRFFLYRLVEDYKHCYYPDCSVKLQFITFGKDLASIERLNNTLGHIKSNCVLACLNCNLRRNKK